MSSLRRARTRWAQRSGAFAVTLAVTSTSLVVLTGTDASARAMAPTVVGPATCSSVGLTITALHGPNFYIDSGISPQLMGAYAGYRVTNSGSARTDLWVKLTNFIGGRVALGTGQAASLQIPSLGASSSQALFWFLAANGTGDGAAQNHDIQVWSGRPDLPNSSQVCGSTGGFSAVKETIKAAANKLTSVTVDGGTPKIGNTFTITVQGETGTVGSGITGDSQSFWMTPAASDAWPANAYRLVSTSLSLQGTTYTDQLRVAGLNSPNSAYTATYTFRAIGYTATSASVVPIQQITSGTQIKHTDLGTIATLPAISPATNDLTLAKTADVPSLPAGGGDVHYEVAVAGSAGAALDDVVDTVPVGATLKAGTATWRGAAIPDAVRSGQVLTFSGPFTLGASNNKLAYTLTLPATSGDRSNSVIADVGSARIDASLSLTNDTPAGIAVHVDAPPVAVDDVVDAVAGTPIDVAVLGNDTDAENDTLALVSATSPTHGSTSTAGAAVHYVPAPGYLGTDSFDYTVSDGKGGTDTGTVSVTVAPPAELVMHDDTASATSGVATPLDVLGNDTGNAPLTVTGVGTPSHGTAVVSGAGSGVTYTSSGGYAGQDSFSYDVVDATGQTGTATVSVSVAAAPQPMGDPVEDATSTSYDQSVLVDVLSNDPEGASVDSVGAPAHGSAVLENGRIRYTPSGTFTGVDTFTYTIAGSETPATVQVEVTASPLTAADDLAPATSGVSTVVDVLANDTGNAPVSVTAVHPAAHGSAVLIGSEVTYTPNPGFEGTDSFTYDVVDVTGQSDQASVTVTVAPPALVAGDDAASTDDVTPVTVHVLDNDHGFGPVSLTGVTQPAYGSAVDNNDGTVTYTPAAGHLGPITFSYDVTDEAELTRSDTGAVTVTVSAAPQPEPIGDPVADTASTPYDESVLVDVVGNDPEGAVVATLGTPEHGTAVLENGQVRYTPAGDFAGTDTFTYRIVGSETTVTVTVEVGGPELQAVDDTGASAHGATAVTIDVLPNDIGTGLTITDVSDTANGGTARIVASGVEVTPADGFRGEDTLTYEITDVVGHTDTATIHLTVPNTAPTVGDVDARTIQAGTATTFALTVADADPDDDPTVTAGTPTGAPNVATQVARSVGTSGGSPTVRLAAGVDVSGRVDVPVTVVDGHGGTATTTLHLIVTPRAPVGVTAGVVGNPAVQKAITAPSFDAAGKPIARTLSTRIDSKVTWRQSATASVTGYAVRVNGTVVCQVADTQAAIQSCTVTDRALRLADDITVTALGVAGTASSAAVVPVVKPSSAEHLLAVVYFPVGQFRLDATARAVLARVDAQAVKYGLRAVLLEGHTDSDGTSSSNQKLSENRSRQVGQWLVDNDDRVHIATDGFGETRPAMTNTTARHKAANRRVEIYVGD